MTDQPAAQAAPAAAAAQVQPPAPPTADAFILTAPAPSAPVAETSAPKMAPAVPEAALPGLDAKVDTYLDSLLKAASKLPGVGGQGRPTCAAWATTR